MVELGESGPDSAYMMSHYYEGQTGSKTGSKSRLASNGSKFGMTSFFGTEGARRAKDKKNTNTCALINI